MVGPFMSTQNSLSHREPFMVEEEDERELESFLFSSNKKLLASGVGLTLKGQTDVVDEAALSPSDGEDNGELLSFSISTKPGLDESPGGSAEVRVSRLSILWCVSVCRSWTMIVKASM